jgi:hypothetical protein
MSAFRMQRLPALEEFLCSPTLVMAFGDKASSVHRSGIFESTEVIDSK